MIASCKLRQSGAYKGNTGFTVVGAMRWQYQCLLLFKLIWAILVSAIWKSSSGATTQAQAAARWQGGGQPCPPDVAAGEGGTDHGWTSPAKPVASARCLSVQAAYKPVRKSSPLAPCPDYGRRVRLNGKGVSEAKRVARDGLCQDGMQEVNSKYGTWSWREDFLCQVGKGVLMRMVRMG